MSDHSTVRSVARSTFITGGPTSSVQELLSHAAQLIASQQQLIDHLQKELMVLRMERVLKVSPATVTPTGVRPHGSSKNPVLLALQAADEPMSARDLAERTGCTLWAVRSLLKRWQDQGLIEYATHGRSAKVQLVRSMQTEGPEGDPEEQEVVFDGRGSLTPDWPTRS